MPNQPKSFNRTIRLDPQLAADADEKARRQGTTLSAVIRMLLTEWVYDDEPD